MSFCDKILEKMKNIKLFRQERGSILILTALLLPIMFGCLGIAYDVGNIYIHKARLQNVTDAAALAAGRAYLESQKKTETETIKKDTYDSYANGRITDEEYVIGGSKDDSNYGGYHPDADKAADDYIYKNIINLGEKVYSDKYSHYALPGLKKVGEDYINDSKIFYRVGLYETVPLYFLPVLTNRNVETVRAGSVVVIEPGTTTVISGETGTGTTTVSNPSIFDNLFTYSEYFDPGLANANHQHNETFDGNMVFTYGNGSSTKEHFYDISKITGGSTQSVDHLFNDSSANLQAISNNQNNEHWTKVNDPIIDTYFKTDAYVNAFKNKLNQPHYDNPNQNLKITGDKEESNSTCRQQQTASGSSVSTNVYHVSSKFQGNVPNFTLDVKGKMSGDDNIPIYVIVEDDITHIQIDIKSNTRPIIFVYFGTNNILINNNGVTVTDYAKLTIYAPYGTVGLSPDQEQLNYTGDFIGNIIAKGIAIQASGGNKYTRWIQQNHLENANYTDTDVAAVTSEIEETIKNATKLSDDEKAQIMQRYSNALTSYANLPDMDDPLFYSKLSYDAKQTLYTTWQALREEFPQYADSLWPWNEHFENGEVQTVTTPDILRLINYRTEFQMRDDLVNNDVLDPFIFETLNKPNSY